MPCFHPLQGYRSRRLNENGKRPIVFKADQGYIDMAVKVPCGRCIGCRLEHSRQWAIRCVHEAQMHDKKCFLTLTYNQENLPQNHSLDKQAIPKFIRSLRKRGIECRYFGCGEYGENKRRPHYHIILFGYDFPDKKIWSTANGNILYRSNELERIWTKGFSTIGEVTFESAAYVARYIMKKHKPDSRKDKEEVEMANALVDPETGEIHQLEPEFVVMSRRPGIGKKWLEKYKTDTDKDFITINGKIMSLPKYYDSLLEQKEPEEWLKRKAKRVSAHKAKEHDNTLDRRLQKEKVKNAQISMLHRNLENQK